MPVITHPLELLETVPPVEMVAVVVCAPAELPAQPKGQVLPFASRVSHAKGKTRLCRPLPCRLCSDLPLRGRGT